MNSDNITFNSIDLDKEINRAKRNIYIKDENNYFSFIDKSIKKEKNEKYFINIKNNKEQYVGVLTENFKKEYLGYNLYEQGDQYLGEISEEKKHGFGIYKFNLNKKDKNEDEENIYFGDFTDNQINGTGIYLYIYKKEEDKSNKFNSIKLTKYNCCIGLFEKGIFKKGKIYIYDNNFEKLYFKNMDEKDKNNFIIEKKDDIILISKGVMEKDNLIEGNIISLNKDKVEEQFSFKVKDNSYIFGKLNDDIKNEMIKEYKDLKFDKFSSSIQKSFSEFKNMQERLSKVKNFEYGKSIKKDSFKKIYLKYLNDIIN